MTEGRPNPRDSAEFRPLRDNICTSAADQDLSLSCLNPPGYTEAVQEGRGRRSVAWWMTNRLRLIQNNLREVDAALDVEAAIRELESFEANVWMMNAGGIFAFYPSSLEYHYVTPHLRKDLLGEAVEKAHRSGLKFIARFDFSKAHESIFAKRPEWFYRRADGREVNYGGIVHTCLNGGYQQEYALRIMDEVLTKYSVDGVFFNMFGYKTTDYSGREYGICHCDSCRKRFRERSGLELPERLDESDPAFLPYRAFQEETTRDILDRIHAFVRGKSEEIAICTYHPYKVDIVRKESNTALSRPHPVWLYSASENVMTVEDSWDDKLASNCSINAIDLQYRFAGVSRHETAIRLYENVAGGSGLDFCIIGAFEGYTDDANLETARDIFRFHRRHEETFGGARSVHDVALVKPDGSNREAICEYYGVFKALKEAHVPFKAVEQEALADSEGARRALAEAKAIVLPGIRRVTEAQAEAIDAARERGATLVGTGAAVLLDEERLRRWFGAAHEGTLEDTDAAYVAIDDRETFRTIPSERQWVIVRGPFARVAYAYASDAQTKLAFVEPSSFGPPERAYGHRIEGRYHGLGCIPAREGRGGAIYFPWGLGEAYYRHGYEDHKHLLVDALRSAIGPFRLETDAPPSVETFLSHLPDGSLLIQWINLSGFNGVSYHAPLPIRGIETTLRGVGARARATTLDDGEPIPLVRSEDGTVRFRLETLRQYEAVLVATTAEKEGESGA